MTTAINRAASTQTSAWQRNPKPEIGEDAKGKFVMVQPGNTAGDIALLLEKNGQKIPPELAPYYFAKSDANRPDPAKHEGNLPVGKKFYLPAAEAQSAAALPGWLAKPTATRPAPATQPAESTQAAPDSIKAAPTGQGGIPPGPGLQARIANEAPGVADNVGSLQSGLVEDLAKLPATMNDAQRETFATQFAEGIAKNPSVSDSAKKQLTFVAKAWAQNPANIDDDHRGALWTPGQQFSNGSKTLEQALKEVAPRMAATPAAAAAAAQPETAAGPQAKPGAAPSTPATGIDAAVIAAATKLSGSAKLDAAKAEMQALSLEARDPTKRNNPEWLKQADKRMSQVEGSLSGQENIKDMQSLQNDPNYQQLSNSPNLKLYRLAHGRNEAIQDGSDFTGSTDQANQFMDDLMKVSPGVRRAILRDFPDIVEQMRKGESFTHQVPRRLKYNIA